MIIMFGPFFRFESSKVLGFLRKVCRLRHLDKTSFCMQLKEKLPTEDNLNYIIKTHRLLLWNAFFSELHIRITILVLLISSKL